ncbi:MAG TPA: acyl carrier protein [Stellaceae bacterium]|nr:acyl carrier protein [Stellaceae bacterium]
MPARGRRGAPGPWAVCKRTPGASAKGPPGTQREVKLSSSAPWIERLVKTPLSERAALLEALVGAEFRAWLLMNDTDELPLDESYFALGLTSLGATEIQERLQNMIGRQIDSSSLFNNPTIRHLLTFMRLEVLREYFTAAPLGNGGPAMPQDDVAADEPVLSGEQQSQKDLLTDVLKDLYGT